jgi:hypothetical protein
MCRRVALLCLVLAALGARTARADKDADDAKALLDKLAQATSKDERLAAAGELAAIGGRAVDTLKAFLARTHASTPDQRRAVLKQIKASVPDKKGNFQSPGHEKASAIRADDEFDWLAALAELPPSTDPALGEVIADDAAIRALAASKKTAAAAVILGVAFAADTIIYRDECGRYLRKMSPYSVPALIVASQKKKDHNLSRYSNYQLERMDRQEPNKALAAADDDEDLQLAVLQAYGDTEHREAVGAVATYLDDESPRVRAQARKVWLAYVTPPDPPPPPRKQLQLNGGVKANKSTPLYFNSLQLAHIEIQRITQEMFQDTVAEEADDDTLQKASQRIFDEYDRKRHERDAGEYAAGKQKGDSGDLAGAIAVFDRLLAEDPQRPERVDMAPVYFAYGDQLATQEKWADAAAMYSKAHGLAPEGTKANDALAAAYLSEGKAEEAAGKDGSASFRRAVALRPDYAEAKQAETAAAAADAPSATSNRWMLYVAGGVAAGALTLFALGLARRPARR